jgi:hypothetical protein
VVPQLDETGAGVLPISLGSVWAVQAWSAPNPHACTAHRADWMFHSAEAFGGAAAAASSTDSDTASTDTDTDADAADDTDDTESASNYLQDDSSVTLRGSEYDEDSEGGNDSEDGNDSRDYGDADDSRDSTTAGSLFASEDSTSVSKSTLEDDEDVVMD